MGSAVGVACAVWSTPMVAAKTNYKLETAFVGEDFFSEEKWTFFDDADPTTGAVAYQNKSTALARGMVKAEHDKVYMGPDLSNVKPGDGIPSIRIESVKRYNSGLFVFGVAHQPTGCSVWPAFWMTGDDPEHPWPSWGEADFIEGANGQSQVWTTLHTLEGCDQAELKSGVDFSGYWMSGLGDKNSSTNCSILDPTQGRNEGCPIIGPPGTMGPLFNAGGGGTYVFEWDPVAGHIRGYFFKAGSEPADLVAGKPDPDTWGLPMSKFLINDKVCPERLFQNMKIVINTDYCGAWGQLDITFHKDCPELPKNLTCPEWVSMYPGNLTDSFWSITRLDVYQNELAEEEVVI